MDKTALSESDICDRRSTPELERAGWSTEQWRREFGYTDGKMIVRGRLVARRKARPADYFLFYRPNIQIGVIEAKDYKRTVAAWMQQTLEYSARLDGPLVFSSDGDELVMVYKTDTCPVKRTNVALDELLGALLDQIDDVFDGIGEAEGVAGRVTCAATKSARRG